MSWQRNIFALAALMLLAACGFQPVYGERSASASSALAGMVRVESSADPLGQQFKQNIEDRLNPQGNPTSAARYVLRTSLSSTVHPMGIERDGTISRYNVALVSHFTLTRLHDGVVVVDDHIRHTGSYNNQPNLYFSSYVAQRDAERRGVVELSEIYRQRISALVVQHEN